MDIDGRPIGSEYPPFVIAELSANHNGSLENALSIIDAAAECGACAVKFQTYTADTITIDHSDPMFQIKDGLWNGRKLYDLYHEAHTPWSWHQAMFERAAIRGITAFSSPFDHTAVDFLEELGAPAYKIASFEAIDLPLIRYVAQTRKPMIISTGMASEEEIAEAIDAARDGGCDQLAILHCVSGYPAPAKDYNLRTLSDMRDRFGIPVGLSDHTLDNATAIASVALGASVIEKHFTLDRSGGGPDDSFSLEPNGLRELVKGTRIAWEALGKIDYGHKSSEKGNAAFRRSLFVVQDIMAGELLTETNIRSIRPGYGLPPKHYETVLGKLAAKDLTRGTPLSWDAIEQD